MENNKSFVWPQGILLALIALGGSLSLGLIVPMSLNTFTTNAVNLKDIEIKGGTQQRLNQFKLAMLTSWQQQARVKGLSYNVPTRFQGVIVNRAKLAPNQKVIALTFDDGPWPEYTAKVLNILRENNIKATFFVVGQMLKNHPELGKQIVAEGHVIGNHTWHHWYHFFNQQAAAFEIDRTSDLIYELTGAKTTLFRPPGGMLHNGLVTYARGKKYTIVMWSADSVDYKTPSAAVLTNRVLKQGSPGGIVLMHDGGGNRSHTVAALPQIISKFKQQGYRFVTVPELFELEEKDEKMIANTKK
ncbi:MAG: polysaccharide deacetylase family protein [Chlorogloeopsis fritschii C42_A2020_084]|uniref:polysaccharide deacetylase family protein n=1 Tax=Chlorogloeopsis fritschii TaxID=1124 RepID=UPI001A08D196|nr:polysaccharide deacetylase family protein [Chlorogloeopsis fritschii]MBF2003947.1 polysaccharide deacetylase family protein [Chlorogloeopsis fritschii C42_A2020_084]